jgi:hypothetical protein
MTDEIFPELGELQRQAVALQGLIAAAQASAPRQAEGADSTGSVWATIGPDGLPAALFIQDDWQRRLPGGRLGTAVVEAFATAADRRVVAWNEALSEGDWPSTVDRVRTGLADPRTDGPRPGGPRTDGPRPGGSQADALGPPALPAVEPARSLNDLLSDMLTAFDAIDTFAPPAIVAQGSGTSGYQKLVVGLSAAGLVSCVVDEPWAAQQDAATLMAAFAEALSRAKTDLARAQSSRPAPDPDRVLGQALELLNDPGRLAES